MPYRIINPKEKKRTTSTSENNSIESSLIFNIDLPEMSLSKRMCPHSEVKNDIWQTPQETTTTVPLYQSNIMSHDTNIRTSSQTMKNRGQNVSHKENSMDLNMAHKPGSISDTEEFFLDVPRKGCEYYVDNELASEEKYADEPSRNTPHFSGIYQVKPDIFSTPKKKNPNKIIPNIQNSRFLQPRFQLQIRSINSESTTNTAETRGFFLTLPR